MTASDVARAGQALARARRVLVVTGAGISAESGIPTFRGAGGLWEGFRAEELATPEAFAADPARVWRWYQWRRAQYGGCEPNAGHRMLVALEARSERFLCATQNVDGLHRRAGSQRVLELHGSVHHARCTRCGVIEPMGPPDPSPPALPRCAACGALTRPHILWFGETYWPGVLEEAAAAAEEAEVCLVIGTSAQVWPPVQLALHAKACGAVLIDVNPQRTQLSDAADVYLAGPAGTVLPEVWSSR